MKAFFSSVLLSCVLLSACDTGTKLDSQKIAEEVRNRKIVHLSQAQITENAFQEGKALSGWLDKRLLLQLQTTPDKKNSIKWAAHCDPKMLSADSLQKAYAVTIERIGLRADPKKIKLSDKAMQIWDAYRYNAENKLPMEPNVQRDGEAFLLYSSPILLADATCLKCHGVVGKDLSTTDFQLLAAKYPAIDSLVNNTLGQPIGVWNLLFDKAKQIQRAKAK